ncbi:MAG: hypothetical protein VKJ04_10915 [Vampirovibrionales bacterium]|nr:hypothetical protein [Vampirovibrionales bacterium]
MKESPTVKEKTSKPYQSVRGQARGQAMVELIGTLAISALTTAAVWAICHYTMPIVFNNISAGNAQYYDPEK